MTAPGTDGTDRRDRTERNRRSGQAYRCLGGHRPEVSGYRVCTLRQCDIQSIRIWRNVQIDVLRQASPISPLEQRRYYDLVVRPAFRADRPALVLLSLLLEESCIGYAGLTNIDWFARRAEISFLLDPDRVERTDLYRRDFAACLKLLSHTAFELLGLHRLFAETFDVRPLHVEILEAHGYVLEGRMRDHVRIEGGRVDSLIHGLLRPDWRDGREPPFPTG